MLQVERIKKESLADCFSGLSSCVLLIASLLVLFGMGGLFFRLL